MKMKAELDRYMYIIKNVLNFSINESSFFIEVQSRKKKQFNLKKYLFFMV